MKIKEISAKLKDGSITLIDTHRTKSFLDRIDDGIAYVDEKISEITNGKSTITNGKSTFDNPENMKSFYEKKLDWDFDIGDFIHDINLVSNYCPNCGSKLNLVLVSKTEITYVSSNYYWDLADKSGDKHRRFKFTKEMIQPCAAEELIQAKVLKSEIFAKTGNIVFQNTFKNDKLYKLPEDIRHTHKYSLNSIWGIYNTMQYYANELSVGYGQTDNTSLRVWVSKKLNEVIITDCAFEYYDEDKLYYDENPDELKNLDEDNVLRINEVYNRGLSLQKLLDDGEFVETGDGICCDVWRWMCADESVLNDYNEIPDEDSCVTNLLPGYYTIENYSAFPENDPFVVSRIKLKN